MARSPQTGLTLTEVNLAVVLSMLLLVPFIAFYAGMQQAFLASYRNLSYLHQTRLVGTDILENLKRVDTPAPDTASLRFPAAPAAVVDYLQPTDKHVQVTFTPRVGGVIQPAQNIHYSYDEANEIVYKSVNGGNYKPITEPGIIKAFVLQYFDRNSHDAVTPAPLINPTNVRRARLLMLSHGRPWYTVHKPGLDACAATPFNIATGNLPEPYEWIVHNAGGNAACNASRPSPLSSNVNAATALTLTPTTGLSPNQWNGGLLVLTVGKGRGQKVGITTNTAAQFNLNPPFTTVPDATSQFKVYLSDFEGTAEGGSAISTTPLSLGTLQDIHRNWQNNEWVGYYVAITAGTGAGQTAKIVSNNSTTLALIDGFREDLDRDDPLVAIPNSATTYWRIAPNNTSRYVILPRFYGVEEGQTTHGVATTDQLRDETKAKKWKVELYPYKNRPLADRDSRVYSSFLQGFMVEIINGASAGHMRPIISNCIAGQPSCTSTRLEFRPADPFPTAIAANTRYRIIRSGQSETLGFPPSGGSSQYTLPDFGKLTTNSIALTQITDASKAWTNNFWVGGYLVFRISQNQNGGIVGSIVSNTATTVNFTTTPAPPLATLPQTDDRYLLIPPDSQPIAAATVSTVTLQPPLGPLQPPFGAGALPPGGTFPDHYWAGGYMDTFDPANIPNSNQTRRIIASNGNVVTVSPNFVVAPIGSRYKIYHHPYQLIPNQATAATEPYLRTNDYNDVPFTYINEVGLRKVTESQVF